MIAIWYLLDVRYSLSSRQRTREFDTRPSISLSASIYKYMHENEKLEREREGVGKSMAISSAVNDAKEIDPIIRQLIKDKILHRFIHSFFNFCHCIDFRSIATRHNAH